MLELNKYSIKEIENLKDFITVTFIIIDDIYQEVTPAYIKNRRNINESIMSDSEIITIAIVGELLTIDSENAWFHFARKNLRDLFPKFCERSRFNRTRKNLHAVIEEIRVKIPEILGYSKDPYRIIDSIPVPVCKFGRARFHKSFKGLAAYGKCASKKETYLGFKLHFLSTFDGFITDFVLTDASIDDRLPAWELLESYYSATVIGDKGYINKTLSPELKKEKDVDLVYIKRDNSKNPYPKNFRQLVFKARRRIETSFSQLCEQLNIEKVKSKTLLGLMTRIRTKVLSHNLCYFINRALGKETDLGRIKHLIFG